MITSANANARVRTSLVFPNAIKRYPTNPLKLAGSSGKNDSISLKRQLEAGSGSAGIMSAAGARPAAGRQQRHQQV